MHTPMLETLMGYYHQDFDIYDGTLWGALNQFIADATYRERVNLLADITIVLDTFSDDGEVDAYLDTLGSEVYMGGDPGGYRGWLEEIARRVRAASV